MNRRCTRILLDIVRINLQVGNAKLCLDLEVGWLQSDVMNDGPDRPRRMHDDYLPARHRPVWNWQTIWNPMSPHMRIRPHWRLSPGNFCCKRTLSATCVIKHSSEYLQYATEDADCKQKTSRLLSDATILRRRYVPVCDIHFNCYTYHTWQLTDLVPRRCYMYRDNQTMYCGRNETNTETYTYCYANESDLQNKNELGIVVQQTFFCCNIVYILFMSALQT
jgi:hypothetical protein